MPIPSSATMDQYRVTDPNQSEVTRQRLWDYNLLPAAGQQEIIFFGTAIGQGMTSAPGATVGSPKTKFDTTQDIGATLPSGKQYLIETIEVAFQPGSVSTANTFTPQLMTTITTGALSAAILGTILDTQTFYENGLLEFWILDKNFLKETPLRSFPPKTWLGVDAALAAATTQTTTTINTLISHINLQGRPYILEPEITLQPAVNFNVKLAWPANTANAMPSTFNARVGVILDGYLQRASQ